MNQHSVDWSQLTPCAELLGEDAEETAMLRAMLEEAKTYIASFSWAPPISEMHFGGGVGGIYAIFFVTFVRPVNDTDPGLWVIVGDLPSAYCVVDEAPAPSDALRVYCDLMEEWATAVLSGSSLDDVYPVAAPPTPDHARKLLTRIEFLRERILTEP